MVQRLTLETINRMIGREPHTGGMIALVPSSDDSSRLAVAGYEPSHLLHVTLYFLGTSAEWTPVRQQELFTGGGNIAESLHGPVEGNVWASANFNPEVEPAATYLVGGQGVANAHEMAALWMSSYNAPMDMPPQHVPWVPHITIGYGLDPAALKEFGPVTFDRLRVAFGETNAMDFKL